LDAVRHVEIAAGEAGQRIDNFLFRVLKGVPKGHIYRLLRTGQVRINGGRAKPTRRLAAGDDIRIPPIKRAAAKPRAADGAHNLDWLVECIVYEDDGLLVLNKPAGLAVHGGSGLRLGAIEALRTLRPRAPYLELVHRLDRDTSGCLMIAKRRSRLRALHELLRTGQVDKKYLALLSGRANDAVTVDAPLKKHQSAGGERRVRVDDAGKASRTHFKPLARFSRATLVEVSIVTGRTHQIRVHAAHLGCPVAGDDKYGERETNRAWHDIGLKRMFLHAASIAFTAPWNDVPLAFNEPLDDELRAVLTRLER
jgi:23S rRNA pseudouridine955/2504/2580 synthase